MDKGYYYQMVMETHYKENRMKYKQTLITIAVILLLGFAFQATQDWFTYPKKYTMQDTDLLMITNDGLDSTRNISWATVKTYILDTDVLVGVARLDSINRFNNRNIFDSTTTFNDPAIFNDSLIVDMILKFRENGIFQFPTDSPGLIDGTYQGALGEIIVQYQLGLDTLAGQWYVRNYIDTAGVGGGGDVYTDSVNIFKVNNDFLGNVTVDGILAADSGRFLIPRLNASTLYLAELALIDTTLRFVSTQGERIVATQSWVNNSSQVKIDSMHQRTDKLDLDYWGSAATNDSSWRAQQDSNWLKTDSITWILDPYAFYVSNDTLYIDTSYIGGGGSGDMAKSSYDPASIVEQLVGLTASQVITNKTVNGVILTDGGIGTQYLDATGGYSTPAGTGTGEANEGSNLGAGAGVYAQKNGVYLELKSIVAGTGLSSSTTTTEITLNLDGAIAYSNVDNNFTPTQTMAGVEADSSLYAKQYIGVRASSMAAPEIRFGINGDGRITGVMDAFGGYEVNSVEFVDALLNITGNSSNIDVMQSDMNRLDKTNINISGTVTVDVDDKSLIYLIAPIGVSTTVTDFINQVTGQELTVVYVSPTGGVTIQDNSNLYISGNFAMGQGDVIELKYVSYETFSGWVEVSRSNN